MGETVPALGRQRSSHSDWRRTVVASLAVVAGPMVAVKSMTMCLRTGPIRLLGPLSGADLSREAHRSKHSD